MRDQVAFYRPGYGIVVMCVECRGLVSPSFVICLIICGFLLMICSHVVSSSRVEVRQFTHAASLMHAGWTSSLAICCCAPCDPRALGAVLFGVAVVTAHA